MDNAVMSEFGDLRQKAKLANIYVTKAMGCSVHGETLAALTMCQRALDLVPSHLAAKRMVVRLYGELWTRGTA